jgi:hypothetical protein
MGPGHAPAFRGQRGDRRRDDIDFRSAELAALAGVRVQPGDGEARVGDSKAALQATQDGPRAPRSARR